ncbi:MAG: NAD(P)/FAD-dependent oxidoreductase [Gemmatimonadaceae bacterium]|nr:NAD(P)/FAD-dependent oxidoreductase [Gemmatimonadaceae bacterium]
MAENLPGRRLPRVVILGGGFGGLTAARTLKSVPVEVTLIDRTNHHLFQPLLYQVATAMLAPTDITAPIRWILRNQRNARVLMAEALSVDVARRVVLLDEGAEISYDFLIVATGSRHAYFGHDEWEADAPGLKSITDALDMRRRFLLAFEEAEKCEDDALRSAWQTFVVVGGGPTGVELAGMLPEIARGALKNDFRRIDTRQTRVILLEGGPGILVAFPPELSLRAARDLAELGVEVRTNALVTRIDQDAVYVGGDRIPARTVFWAAGNISSPLGNWLDAPLDRAGRVQVEPDLSVPNHPEVFVVGDMAAVVQDGQLVPGVAPAANQEGRTAAKNIARTLAGKPRRNFHYFNKGNLATIGRSRAIAEFGRVHIAGRLAWLMWLGVHIMYLVGFRNRLSVLLQWGYAYVTYQRGARLIAEAPAGRTGRPVG